MRTIIVEESNSGREQMLCVELRLNISNIFNSIEERRYPNQLDVTSIQLSLHIMQFAKLKMVSDVTYTESVDSSLRAFDRVYFTLLFNEIT